jgi:tetratricopeptide (TPR) repeat protein
MEARIEQLMQRARLAFERGDYGAALADALEVLSTHPNFADLRHLAGLCHGFLGDGEAALGEFEHALALNPRYIEAHVNRALTLTELGRYDEARASFESAALHEIEEGGPFTAGILARLANGHAELGDLYMQGGGAADAIAEYRRALELRPAFHDIRNKLAEALIDLGAFQDAREELERVRDGNPRFMAARLNLGLVYYRLQRLSDARQEWEACAALQPGHPQARAYLTMLDGMPGDEPRDAIDVGS